MITSKEPGLYEEMLGELIKYGKVEVTFPDLGMPPEEFMKSSACLALKKIRDIVRDDSLSDPECFQRIEEIVCALEEIGVSCGNRHDFG